MYFDIKYELTFLIYQELSVEEYLVCYVFFLLDQLNYCLETEQIAIKLQRKHNQLPTYPSCNCSTH